MAKRIGKNILPPAAVKFFSEEVVKSGVRTFNYKKIGVVFTAKVPKTGDWESLHKMTTVSRVEQFMTMIAQGGDLKGKPLAVSYEACEAHEKTLCAECGFRSFLESTRQLDVEPEVSLTDQKARRKEVGVSQNIVDVPVGEVLVPLNKTQADLIAQAKENDAANYKYRPERFEQLVKQKAYTSIERVGQRTHLQMNLDQWFDKDNSPDYKKLMGSLNAMRSYGTGKWKSFGVFAMRFMEWKGEPLTIQQTTNGVLFGYGVISHEMRLPNVGAFSRLYALNKSTPPIVWLYLLDPRANFVMSELRGFQEVTTNRLFHIQTIERHMASKTFYGDNLNPNYGEGWHVTVVSNQVCLVIHSNMSFHNFLTECHWRVAIGDADRSNSPDVVSVNFKLVAEWIARSGAFGEALFELVPVASAVKSAARLHASGWSVQFPVTQVTLTSGSVKAVADPRYLSCWAYDTSGYMFAGNYNFFQIRHTVSTQDVLYLYKHLDKVAFEANPWGHGWVVSLEMFNERLEMERFDYFHRPFTFSTAGSMVLVRMSGFLWEAILAAHTTTGPSMPRTAMYHGYGMVGPDPADTTVNYIDMSTLQQLKIWSFSVAGSYLGDLCLIHKTSPIWEYEHTGIRRKLGDWSEDLIRTYLLEELTLILPDKSKVLHIPYISVRICNDLKSQKPFGWYGTIKSSICPTPVVASSRGRKIAVPPFGKMLVHLTINSSVLKRSERNLSEKIAGWKRKKTDHEKSKDKTTGHKKGTHQEQHGTGQKKRDRSRKQTEHKLKTQQQTFSR